MTGLRTLALPVLARVFGLILVSAVHAYGADPVGTDSCEVLIESSRGIIGDMKDKRLMIAFSRRGGKSIGGVCWIPGVQSGIPLADFFDPGGIHLNGGKVTGTFRIKRDGVAEHTYTLDANILENEIGGTWTVRSGAAEESHAVTGYIAAPTKSRDAPMTEPTRIPVDRPWGKVLDVPHPFMVWTRQEADALRRKIETDPETRKQYEFTMEWGKDLDLWPNMFNYVVMGDIEAGRTEKAKLLQIVGSHPIRGRGHRGWEPRWGGRAYDVHADALRYDAVYDLLTKEEREAVEKTFRVFIKFHIYEDYRRTYTRTSWLPNIQWIRNMGTHLMAVALRDEEAIRRMFHSVGGWKWYLDEYIGDDHFYMEEFGKQPASIGNMLLWCESLKRLGLDELGYGYVGLSTPGVPPAGPEGGATMRSYMNGLQRLGLPRIDVPGGRPFYPHIHMGDADASLLACGYTADGNPYSNSPRRVKKPNPVRIKAGVPGKLRRPSWFEIAHRQWPDDGFDYFLAQMRNFGERKYYPSVYFYTPPIDVAKVTPPPAPSYVAWERGFAMLRHEEGPAYWEGPAPAVALQFGMYYVHYVHDCFIIMQYHALNRSMLGRRAFGPHRGYAGGHPWIDTVRGHNGVVVDNRQIQWVDDGNEGCRNQQIRSAFSDPVKFVAVRAKPHVVTRTDPATGAVTKTPRALYPGVDAERALFLTGDYLVDLFDLASKEEHVYDWMSHPLGEPVHASAETWKPTDELNGGKLWDLSEEWTRRHRKSMAAGAFDLGSVRKRVVGADPWSHHTRQPNGVGVIIRMLAAENTSVFRDVGGAMTTLLVRRRAPSTRFVTLYEPIGSGSGTRIAGFESVAETERGIALRIRGAEGTAIDDRVLFSYARNGTEPITLKGGEERFTFRDHAYLRIAGDTVTATGELTAMRLKSPTGARMKVVVNGNKVETQRDGEFLVFTAGR